jgi:hypothetical protein
MVSLQYVLSYALEENLIALSLYYNLCKYMASLLYVFGYAF